MDATNLKDIQIMAAMRRLYNNNASITEISKATDKTVAEVRNAIGATYGYSNGNFLKECVTDEK